jgi:multidrug efflux pump
VNISRFFYRTSDFRLRSFVADPASRPDRTEISAGHGIPGSCSTDRNRPCHLVLCAVFVPTAFISGLTGQFYRQFALTIAISTVISAFNSLTLSPALCAILLRPAHAPEDWLTRTLNFLLGWFFWPFNRVFRWSSNFYSKIVQSLLRRTVVALVVYAGLLAFTFYLFQNTPSGFVPLQDKQYLVAFAQVIFSP